MIRPVENHPHEYPIVRFWYTKHAGHTIERIIDTDESFFEWAVRTFQDVTPAQAEYYHRRIGKEVPKVCIRDVEPYEWIKGDPELDLYMELCKTGDLKGVLRKWRGEQLSLFE